MAVLGAACLTTPGAGERISVARKSGFEHLGVRTPARRRVVAPWFSFMDAFFMPLDSVLPLVANCLDDGRETVQKAVGWVLGEAAVDHGDAIVGFVTEHSDALAPIALRRATERMDVELQAALRTRAR